MSPGSGRRPAGMGTQAMTGCRPVGQPGAAAQSRAFGALGVRGERARSQLEALARDPLGQGRVAPFDR